MNILITFTGGGTGGHVYPGLAVIDKLKEDGSVSAGEMVWLGSGKGIEKKIVEDYGLSFKSIPAGKLRRYFSMQNFSDIFKVAGGFFCSFFYLAKKRPKLLFSKGGFVSVPPVLAAHLLKIPVITHESDSIPGLATRINSKFADMIMVPYEETKNRFPETVQNRVVVTGNPVRSDILKGDPEEGRRISGAGPDEKIILVMGGSLGALQINELIESLLPELPEGCFIVHQTGNRWKKNLSHQRYRAFEYIGAELPHLLAASHFVISRAGAAALWENAATGKPALLIPLGTSSSRGEQVHNARLFEKMGAAAVLAGEEATPDAFRKEVESLLSDRERYISMKEASNIIGNKDGAGVMAREILNKVKDTGK